MLLLCYLFGLILVSSCLSRCQDASCLCLKAAISCQASVKARALCWRAWSRASTVSQGCV